MYVVMYFSSQAPLFRTQMNKLHEEYIELTDFK
jgi:hypothetical protein